MRTIVHLSDLHFGRVDAALITPLRDLIHQIAPTVVVVSGDLTQRARTAEFEAARRFLDTLAAPQIVVPGNHDISLHNPFDRFVRPLAKFRRHISSDPEPFYRDDEVAIAGINTARSLTIKDGRISHQQMVNVKARFAQLPAAIVRVVVTHHPFDLPGQYHRGELVGRASAALATFADCGADLLLAGHLHASHASTTAARYPIGGYAALAVQAGTATSTRGRGESNSFNVLRVEAARIVVERHAWDPQTSRFDHVGSEHFARQAERWVLASAASD